jgi:hypothetical protein
VTLLPPAAVTGYLPHILNPHPCGEQRHSQEEADDEHGDQHQNPRHGLEATAAQHLEDTTTKYTDHEPPEDRRAVTRRYVVQDTGNGHQNNGSGRLTES